MGHLADRPPDEVVDRPVEHLGERAVGVEDRRVVEPHQRHAGRRRVERLLEPSPRLLERAHPLLALGDVAEAHDRPGLGVPGPVDGRLDERARRPVGVRQADGDRRRSPAAPVRQPLVEVGASRRLDDRPELLTREVGDRAAGQLGGLGVGAADDAVVVDRQHRLRQVVEQEAQLGLGVDEPLDRAVEVGGDAPRLEPGDDDRGGSEQRRHDRRGDGAGRAVAVEAQHDGDEGHQQRSGDGDRHEPPPHRCAPADRVPVGHVVAHRLDATTWTLSAPTTTRRGAPALRRGRSRPRRGGSRGGGRAPRRRAGRGRCRGAP